MSAMSRFGPVVARSMLLHHNRNMASTAAALDPVQKLFVEKIREFKSTNQGLDDAHKKALQDEITRLKRVYNVDDESKLAHMEYKFTNEHDVSLRDIDETKELRAKIHSGEYQKQLAVQSEEKSELLATIPDQTPHDLSLPVSNKPSSAYLVANHGVMAPPKISQTEMVPDYEVSHERMTVDRLERQLRVHFAENMPTVHDDENNPQRDLVNFPRLPIPEDTPPTRHHAFPEAWFQIFYNKTGVTGPYTFFASFGTFLLSKEWIPVEHEFITAISTTIILTWAVTKFGPVVGPWLRREHKNYLDAWDHWQQGHILMLGQMKEHLTKELEKSDVFTDLYAARRQDIDVQLECERRNRVKMIYDDTKRRLNFLVAKANSHQQIQHNNMINWVISNVNSSINQKLDNEVLDHCVTNLKQLAGKNANVI